MTTFTIDEQNNISAFSNQDEAAAATQTPFDSFASQKELAELAKAWPAERLVAIFNSLTGVTPVESFKSNKAAASRIWERIKGLGAPEEPKPEQATKPKAKKNAKGGAQSAKGAPAKAKATKKATAAKSAPKAKKVAKATRHALSLTAGSRATCMATFAHHLGEKRCTLAASVCCETDSPMGVSRTELLTESLNCTSHPLWRNVEPPAPKAQSLAVFA